MRKIVAIVLAFGLVAGATFQNAQAFPAFGKQFNAKYPGLADLVKTAKCNVCHDPKKDENGKASKKNRNAYGMALSKLIKKADMKDIPKIQKALTTVESQKAKGAEQTFGELIKAGKLPAGK